MKWIGLGQLRDMNISILRQLQKPVEIRKHAQPLAVLIPYPLYMQWQKEFHELKHKLEEIQDHAPNIR